MHSPDEKLNIALHYLGKLQEHGSRGGASSRSTDSIKGISKIILCAPDNVSTDRLRDYLADLEMSISSQIKDLETLANQIKKTKVDLESVTANPSEQETRISLNPTY